jgi:ERCC4-type nuclease
MTTCTQIIIDSREQQPLIKSVYVRREKLDEGDYNIDGLKDFIVIERKSPGDLYGSIVQGHKRFVDEILRSKLQGKVFYIVVECTQAQFFGKCFAGSRYCSLKSNILASILSTLEERYGIIIVWCQNRIDAWHKVIDILAINYRLFINRNLLVDLKTGKILEY